MVAAIFEAPMSREQVNQLATLMRENVGERAPAVILAMLLYEDGVARLIALWRSRDAWDRYLSTTPVPRATEFMREVGAEPTLKVVPVLEWS